MNHGNRYAILSMDPPEDPVEDFDDQKFDNQEIKTEHSVQHTGDSVICEPSIDLAGTFTSGYIRKHYVLFLKKYPGQFTDSMYSRLWDSWMIDSGIAKNKKSESFDEKLQEIKEFVSNHDIEITYSVSKQDPKQRFMYHQICSKLGLEHCSLNELVETRKMKGVDKEKKVYDPKYKTVRITKPVEWCWDYTAVSNHQQKIDDMSEEKRSEKEKQWRERMTRKRCRVCRKNALQTELMKNEDLQGLFCAQCIEVKTDRDRIPLSDYEFVHAYGSKP